MGLFNKNKDKTITIPSAPKYILDGADKDFVDSLYRCANTESYGANVNNFIKILINEYNKLCSGDKILVNEIMAIIGADSLDMNQYIKAHINEWSMSNPIDMVNAMNTFIQKNEQSGKLIFGDEDMGEDDEDDYYDEEPLQGNIQDENKKEKSPLVGIPIRDYPQSLINVNSRLHQYQMIPTSRFMMEITKDYIGFTSDFIQHMMDICAFLREDSTIQFRQIFASDREYEPLTVDAVHEKMAENYPMHEIASSDELFIHFGKCDKTRLVIAPKIRETSGLEAFKVLYHKEKGFWYLSHSDTLKIQSIFNDSIIGSYIFQFMEGTNTYIGDIIKDIDKQGTNYKIF